MATSGERNTTEREGRVFSHQLAAQEAINRGAMVVLDSGVAKPGFVAAALVCVGVAQASAATADGDTAVNAKLGTFLFANSATDACDEADIGKPCFIEDDETVGATDGGGTRSKAGILRAIEGGNCWVEFN